MSIDTLRAKFFPQLSAEARETSPIGDSYNCIAWAARETEANWWPVDMPTTGVYWPIAADETVDGFVAAFGTLGYERSVDGRLEGGFEKIALYVDSKGEPTHMARQLSSGRWTSKLGTLEDIEHPTPDELCGDGKAYGRVECYLRRPVILATDQNAPE